MSCSEEHVAKIHKNFDWQHIRLKKNKSFGTIYWQLLFVQAASAAKEYTKGGCAQHLRCLVLTIIYNKDQSFVPIIISFCLTGKNVGKST